MTRTWLEHRWSAGISVGRESSVNLEQWLSGLGLMQRIYVIVYGRVQGVGFRYSTQAEAVRLDLTGYVRNRPNGTVEIVAEGQNSAINQLLTWANQGPPAAAVNQVEVTYGSVRGEFSQFTIER